VLVPGVRHRRAAAGPLDLTEEEVVVSAGADSTRTCDQSASSSSAMMVAKPVYVPWPNSMCLAMIVTVLSGAIRRNAFGAK
jgi:hypothetical protein